MHEAFCLDEDQDIFHPYEKNHSTVKSACQVMDKLNVKNLILYHTEESRSAKKKELYLKEGEKYFKNTLYLPHDLDIIEMN